MKQDEAKHQEAMHPKMDAIIPERDYIPRRDYIPKAAWDFICFASQNNYVYIMLT